MNKVINWCVGVSAALLAVTILVVGFGHIFHVL